MTDLMTWVDVETMGLASDDPIIELGITITDSDLKVVDRMSWLCWEQSYHDRWEKAPQVVRDMHTNSGLIDSARKGGVVRRHVERKAVQWLQDKAATGLPICGNSVATDKRWLAEQMPSLLNTFHYRVIDVSTVKELCRRFNPEVFAQAPEKGLAHTALADLDESIAELRFYLDNFLIDGRD